MRTHKHQHQRLWKYPVPTPEPGSESRFSQRLQTVSKRQFPVNQMEELHSDASNSGDEADQPDFLN